MNVITLAHGDGGWWSRELLRRSILPPIDNPLLAALGDAAEIQTTTGRLAFTTDSFVVTPLVFPGGDIGQLAVYGTVNDLAVSGAIPRWLSLSLIIEEGLPLSLLEELMRSVARAAEIAEVLVVTGDTKVVPRGAADRLFITTAGVGELVGEVSPGPQRIEPGDRLIVSGPLGCHGIAILAAREDLGFDPPPESDCCSLAPLTAALRAAEIPVRALRDATRGGLAAVLHEWAAACRCTLTIEETRLPLTPEVRGGCEVLGLDPIHLANEGVLVAAVPDQYVPAALQAIRGLEAGREAQVVGRVIPWRGTPVTIIRHLGIEQPLDLPAEGHLPRIC